jgi:uncharacterized membrane protein
MLHAKTILSSADLKEIADAIGVVEKNTSGEIRVSVRQQRERKEKGQSIEQLARREFVHLGMTKTNLRTGVLIFLLLEDRAFHILGDEGIHARIGDERWIAVSKQMADYFARKDFRGGILHAVAEVGKVLSTHFPRSIDDANELTNDVRIR